MHHRPSVRALVLLTFAAGAVAAQAATPSTAEAVYRQDRAACLEGKTQQERSSCLREAGAALAEARRGQLGSASAETFAANAKRRCLAHTEAAARSACERMAAGEGTTTGTAEAGGILRSLTTVTPAADAPAPKATP